MKIISTIIIICGFYIAIYAGDTNFVASFKTIWKTHDATSILEFTEQNVITNKSPETLFARGLTAGVLQDWSPGATNYWEQAKQMITTNDTYSLSGKSISTFQIGMLQNIFASMGDNPPTWNTNSHMKVFSGPLDEPPLLHVLERISTIPLAE